MTKLKREQMVGAQGAMPPRQCLVEIHTPVYEKQGHVYILRRFMRVGAEVFTTRELLPALRQLLHAPCVVFSAGEARHFMVFGDSKAAHSKTGINMRWGFDEMPVLERNLDGEVDLKTTMMPTRTAMTFFDGAGRLTSVPIMDYMQEFPQFVTASQMLVHMEHIAVRQGNALLRLVGQLCFVNVVGGEVSSTERVLVGKSVTEIGSARLRLRAARFVWSEAASV